MIPTVMDLKSTINVTKGVSLFEAAPGEMKKFRDSPKDSMNRSTYQV